MEKLFELLVPLLFIAVILIVNILARAKEAQKGGSGEKREATPWTRIASQKQIRQFLEDAAGGGQKRPQRHGGPEGMPAGRVTPTARRQTTPTASSPDQAHRREARHVRTPTPPPAPRRGPVEKSTREPQPRSLQSATRKPTFEGGLELRMRNREAKRPKGAPAPGTTLRAAGAPSMGEATQATPAAETPSKLLRKLNLGSLRRAIVLSEALGTPAGLRPPRP